MPESDVQFIVPDWPAAAHVHAGCSTRLGGVSETPYNSLNLGLHVGDDRNAVAANRAILKQAYSVPAEPLWLEQVHGIDVVDAAVAHGTVTADAAFTRRADEVCVVMSADCLPVLLCDRKGSVVAAVHAGWRGLAAGVIEAAVKRMDVAATDLMAWLGPAIGPDAFEVGSEVRDQFIAADVHAEAAFRHSARGRWLADIYLLARQRLNRFGIEEVYGGHWCTYSDAERFFSYRRDGDTGRMATLIWLSQSE